MMCIHINKVYIIKLKYIYEENISGAGAGQHVHPHPAEASPSQAKRQARAQQQEEGQRWGEGVWGFVGSGGSRGLSWVDPHPQG